jgi:hypothetical protein
VDIEISGLAPEHHVGYKSHAGGNVLAECYVLIRIKDEPAGGKDSGEHQNQRGK